MAGTEDGSTKAAGARASSRRSLSKRLRSLLFRSSGGICAMCGTEIDHSFHADHGTPWSFSKTTNVHEMQALCGPCNLAKGATMLRKHQIHADQLALDPKCGVLFKTVIAAVTPGGGKSSLPVIFGHRLKARNIIDRILWVAPRDSLREQAERAFLDPLMRGLLGHDLKIRASGNDINPARGTDGYVTTFQAIAAEPDLHAHEMTRARYLVVLDETHHVAEGGVWHGAIKKVIDQAAFVVLMTGTASRADGKRIAFLPYAQAEGDAKARVDLRDGHDRRTIRYSRIDALAERAILPIYFERLDGKVEWVNRQGEERKLASLRGAEGETGDALYTALNEAYAHDLLKAAVEHWKDHRETVNKRAKLLVVAASIGLARRYLSWLWKMDIKASDIATSDDGEGAKRNIKRFKGESRDEAEIDALVTVAMAYEGMDCPAVTHIACLTHIRAAEWIEQMLARGTRFDRHAKNALTSVQLAWEDQACFVWAPDDDLFSQCIAAIVAEQAPFVKEKEGNGGIGGDRNGVSGELLPLRGVATETRAENMQSGEVIEAEQVKRAKEAMKANGLRGISVFNFLAAMKAFQEHEPAEAAAEIEPEMTVSEREQRLRQAIDKRIKRHCNGDGLAIKEMNLRIIRAFGVKRDEMTVAQLEELWGFLDKFIGQEADLGTGFAAGLDNA